MYVYGDFNLPKIQYESVDVEGGTATYGYITSNSAGSKSSDKISRSSWRHGSTTNSNIYQDTFNKEPKNTLDLIITDDPIEQ